MNLVLQSGAVADEDELPTVPPPGVPMMPETSEATSSKAVAAATTAITIL